MTLGRVRAVLGSFLGAALLSFVPGTVDAQPYTAEPAPEWDALFDRESGWTGADAVYSVPLDGDDRHGAAGPKTETLWLFGDTAIGDVAPDGRRLAGTEIVNNTVAFLTGSEPNPDQISFLWRGQRSNDPLPVFVPTTPNAEPEDWYWPMDGLVLERTLHLFMLRLRKDGAFFAIVGVALVSLDLNSEDPYGTHQQVDTPLFREATAAWLEAHFGQAILVNTKAAGAVNPDGFVYIYGQEASQPVKGMVAARVLPEQLTDFTAWRYWDGFGWSELIEDAVPITNRISTEFSMSPLPDGRFVAVFQADGLGADVAIRVGDSPVGPFGPMRRIYRCPEVDLDPEIFVYNAKAHPHLSQPGELLISYNVNTFDFFGDFFRYADIYRPRFIRLIALP